jgi:hypothetical protein
VEILAIIWVLICTLGGVLFFWMVWMSLGGGGRRE